jgi:hypothetical protein
VDVCVVDTEDVWVVEDVDCCVVGDEVVGGIFWEDVVCIWCGAIPAKMLAAIISMAAANAMVPEMITFFLLLIFHRHIFCSLGNIIEHF